MKTFWQVLVALLAVGLLACGAAWLLGGKAAPRYVCIYDTDDGEEEE